MFTKNYSSKTKQMAKNRLTIILLTRWQKNELPVLECAIASYAADAWPDATQNFIAAIDGTCTNTNTGGGIHSHFLLVEGLVLTIL